MLAMDRLVANANRVTVYTVAMSSVYSMMRE